MSSLPISTLRFATSAVKNSIGSCAPSRPANTQIKLSDFKVSGIVSLSADKTEVAYGDTVTYKIIFNGQKSQFFNIKKIPSNYISEITFGSVNPETLGISFYTFVSETEDSKTYKNALLSYRSGNYIDATVKVKFFDKTYNQDATNYNLYFDKSIRIYKAPQPSLAYYSSTAPPPPCCGSTSRYTNCCDASITLSYNTNPSFGVNSSRLDIYYSSDNSNFTLFATVYASSGTVTKANLTGSTTYYFRAINSFGIYSDTVTTTTPAYVYVAY